MGKHLISLDDDECELIKSIRNLRCSIRKGMNNNELEIKPLALLSDDEKVILKNIITDNYKYIHRDKCGVLWISQDRWLVSRPFRISDAIYWFGMYRHLFQFIEKGEEYSIKRLIEIKEEAEMPL